MNWLIKYNNIFSIHGSQWVYLHMDGSAMNVQIGFTYVQQLKIEWACQSVLLCHWGRHLFPVSSRSGMWAPCALSLPVSDLLVLIYTSTKLGDMGKNFKKHEEHHWK